MPVRLEKQGGVGIVVLDRPPVNAYDYEMLRSFASVIDDIRADEDIHAVVVTSASEKFFSTGADVKAFAAGTTRSRVMTA
ncbi:MAG TPA: enoyl-CoA hydratase/isomerase family protein, partial [Candidatus Dormibacteraeota bacterium]|nr:enoyl-CoA hydratase/isomerase family protein [Candidatus Dormibacteraeota bacterium]